MKPEPLEVARGMINVWTATYGVRQNLAAAPACFVVAVNRYNHLLCINVSMQYDVLSSVFFLNFHSQQNTALI